MNLVNNRNEVSFPTPNKMNCCQSCVCCEITSYHCKPTSAFTAVSEIQWSLFWSVICLSLYFRDLVFIQNGLFEEPPWEIDWHFCPWHHGQVVVTLWACANLFKLSANTVNSWDIASSYNHGAAANLKPTLVWGLTVGRMLLNGTNFFLGRHMAVSTVTYTFISMH